MVDTSTGSVATTGQNGSLVQRSQSAMAWTRGISDQPSVRRAMPAIILLTAAMIGLVAYLFLNGPKQVALNTGLPEAEKSAALDLLTGQGVKASIDPDTGNLRVLKTDYYRARMALAAEGLPQGTPDGLSTITDMPMGTSRSVETARLRRMHELDLARSISEIRAITQARVHLALPERTAFIRDNQPPRASVFVQVAAGHTLDQSQVEAIVSLVSTSIPGMAPGNVSVVDQTGRLLSTNNNDPITAMSDQQARQRMQMEQLLRSRVEALITPIVGVGNAAVQVTLDMDFTRSEVTNEEFSPSSKALRSEQEMSEESSQGKAGGIPGAIANTPPTAATLGDVQPDGAAATSTATALNRSSSSTRNYEVSRRVETIQPPSSRITRINAAVLLRAPTSTDPTAPAVLPDQVLADITALTRTAIGYDDSRGDTITVSSSPFIDTFDVYELPWYKAEWIPQVGRVLAQLVALAIVIIGIIRPILSRLLPKPSENGVSPALTETIEVGEGDTLSNLRERLDQAAGGLDLMPNEAVSYEEKVALLRHMAEIETGRVAAVFQHMIERDKEVTS